MNAETLDEIERARAQREAGVPAPAVLDLREPLPTSRTLVAARYAEQGIRALMFWQEEFLHFRAGTWLTVPPSEVKAAVYEFIEGSGETPTRRVVGEVVDALKATVFLNPRIEPPCWLDDPTRSASDLLVCSNGAFDLRTGSAHPLTPKLFSRVALPVAFDPAAAAPVEWLRFLNSLWPGDQESIATLQEIGGLLLTPLTVFQKLFLIVGPKRSGKGTILRTLAALLGTDSVAAPTLSSLALPFGLQPLIGKLAAFIGDARLGARADQAAITERLLSISGEDHVSIARKFLPDYTGRLSVRFVLSTNELPRLADASGALASRFVVLILRESFYGREDLDLERRLHLELPAILAWCAVGRERLLARGHFEQPRSAMSAIEQLEDLGSPISAFVRETCEISSGLSVSVEELYAAWREWCEAAGRSKPGSLQTFGRDLRAACPGVRVSRPRNDGTRQRVYEGISLVRSGPRSTPLHSHAHARHVRKRADRGPSRTTCPSCDGEGCPWCQEDNS